MIKRPFFTGEHEHRRLLQAVMEIIDEAEKESASHTDVLSLVKHTVTMADCILAIFLNRL